MNRRDRYAYVLEHWGYKLALVRDGKFVYTCASASKPTIWLGRAGSVRFGPSLSSSQTVNNQVRTDWLREYDKLRKQAKEKLRADLQASLIEQNKEK